MDNFIAFDTETANMKGGGQAVLATSFDGIFPRMLRLPVTFSDFWEFIRGHCGPRNHLKFVAWNLQFDAQAIIHPAFLQDQTIISLAMTGEAKEGPWRFEYLPRKYLSISDGHTDAEFYDVYQYYQMSLRAAAEKFLGDTRKLEIPKNWYNRIQELLIKDGKAARRIEDYATADVVCTYKLTQLVQHSFEKLNVCFDNPVSTGTLAKQHFAKQWVPANPSINRIFESSMYGGRVEIFQQGKIGECWSYDLNSAYPSIIQTLKNPQNLWLRQLGHDDQPRSDAVYGTYYITLDVPDMEFGPLAVRKPDGMVYYPVGNFKTWCGLKALNLLKDYAIDHKIIKGYEFYGKAENAGFAMLDLFHARQQPELKLAAKLVMNSTYGIMCEHIDRYRSDDLDDTWNKFSEYGKKANMAMAAYVTESIRIKLWKALRSLNAMGYEAYLCATDGIVTNCPPGAFWRQLGQLSGSAAMGDWSLKGEYIQGLIYGCGRYVLWDKVTNEPEIHFRGFRVGPTELKKIMNCKRKALNIPILKGTSMIESAIGYFLEDYNVLKMVPLKFTMEDTKRAWKDRPTSLSDLSRNVYRSKPWVMM